jgi:hypothetical protein
MQETNAAWSLPVHKQRKINTARDNTATTTQQQVDKSRHEIIQASQLLTIRKFEMLKLKS